MSDFKQSVIDNPDHTAMMVNNCLELVVMDDVTPTQRHEAQQYALGYIQIMYNAGYKVKFVKDEDKTK